MLCSNNRQSCYGIFFHKFFSDKELVTEVGNNNQDAVIFRDGVEIFRGAIEQLKRFKDDVKEVAQGFECGISFGKFNDLQVGDIIQVSTQEEVERTSL